MDKKQIKRLMSLKREMEECLDVLTTIVLTYTDEKDTVKVKNLTAEFRHQIQEFYYIGCVEQLSLF